MSKSNASANYGIVGNVNAKAVAVGGSAKAVVNESSGLSRSDFDAALAALRQQIASLPEDRRTALSGDIEKIEQLAGQKPEHKPAASDLLKSFLEKFKTVGSLLTTAASFQEPLKLLGAWFHVPLPF